MMFCPKCGSMLRPKIVGDKKVMACTCGYKADKSASGSTMSFGKKLEEKKADFEVQESGQSVHTLIDEECPKCREKQVYTWSRQMRAGDEPETVFFKCPKCEHTWREK